MDGLRFSTYHIESRAFKVFKHIFNSEDKRTFGMIINDCKNLGLDLNLGTRLVGFNKARIDAEHNYLLGKTDYDSLKETCILYHGLDKEVGDYVRGSLGLVV